MDAQRRQDLWAIVVENYQAAKLTAQRGWHNVSVACCYYGVFTAMWVALGDPPRRQWSHGGILQHFSPGQWRQSQTPLDRTITNTIRSLYNARLKAQYKAVRLTATDSAESLTTARQILQLVATALGLPQGGITP
ncbi:MAG: hypothetical protein ACREOH_07495 [Candidatus Entotheonellia bacterium]